jgi:cellulose synthase operon protein C
MPRRSPIVARVCAGAVIALSLAAVGCGGANQSKIPRPPGAVEGPVKPLDVRDDDFAARLQGILRDGSRTPARLGALVGVVRRQLAHAQRRFELGKSERATDSALGALYLVRVNEGRGEMIDETGAKALDGAIRYLSIRGDEGRVHALMRMRAAALPAGSPMRAELEEHMGNLTRWMSDTHAGGRGAKLGADERYLVARAMVDPSEEALTQAAAAVEAWVAQGIEVSRAFRKTGKRPERSEGMEAERALETGSATLAALFIRHGDAQGALARIENSEVQLVTKPGLRAALGEAAEGGNARAWEMLAAAFAHEGGASESDEESMRLDPMLVEAGLWGSVLEAYRQDPTSFGTAAVLSEALVRFGMSEGAPAVLSGALGAQPNPRTVGAATRIVFGAMLADADIGDVDAVRRTFRAAGPILAAADRPGMADINPSAARLRLLMASIEVRAGNLAAARPLFESAARAEPSVSAWVQVARAARQAGDSAGAIASIDKALAAPDARGGSLPDVAEAHLLAFELHRDAGAADKAKAALANALTACLAARQQKGDSGARAHAETLLGRVLEAYGEGKAARRAHDRALSLAATDRPMLGPTVLQVVARALVRRDLDGARVALKQGLEADLDPEDRIYGGLWLQLLERELRAAPDGTAERALQGAGDRDAWVSKLSAWATGKLTDEGLGAAAQNAAQRVEAQFYTAMARRAAGDPAAVERLRAVSTSPVIDLVEVQLARDLIAPPLQVQLPPNTQLP